MQGPCEISNQAEWDSTDPELLWIYDRLILSRRLGYLCGPAGTAPPRSDRYVVRPVVNFRGMSRGAGIKWIAAGDRGSVPDGSFWCQRFQGRHISIDYHWGQQSHAVEGFRDDPDRLDRWSRWQRVHYPFELPEILKPVAQGQEWFNVEIIGDRVIEAHLRFNPDFQNHDADVIYPVWQEDWWPSAKGDRVGFWLGARPRRV